MILPGFAACSIWIIMYIEYVNYNSAEDYDNDKIDGDEEK